MNVYVYSARLGSTGLVKVGQTNDPARRRTELGRKYGARKSVEMLTVHRFTSRQTALDMEAALIAAAAAAGLVGVIDPQDGTTERFIASETVPSVTIKARKREYAFRLW